MKPRNREINIFNLSMLDVISGAMAAFLIIMVILMPYYKKQSIDYQTIIDQLQQTIASLRLELEEVQQRTRELQETRIRAQAAMEQAQAAREQARQARAEAERQRRRAEDLAQQLAKTFLVLYVRWGTRDDVDLHVVDPSGAEFWFQKKTVPGRPGELSEDNTNGPGNEVWEIRDAPPGDYKVYVKLYAVKDSRKPVVVKGRLFHRDGSNLMPETQLTRKGQKEHVATISVDDEGNVTVR